MSLVQVLKNECVNQPHFIRAARSPVLISKLSHPDDVWILFESLPTGRHIHHLPSDARLGVLPDGGLPPPPGSQGRPEIILLRSVISLPLGGAW